MRSRKSLLLAATAIAALGFSSTGALAFDEVDWEWNKIVDELVIKRINVNADLVPTGMVELEKLQIFIGDVNAESIVHDIANNPPQDPGTGGGTVTVELPETRFQLSADYIDGDPGGEPDEDLMENNNNDISDVEIVPAGASDLTVAWDPVEGGNVDELGEEFEFDILVGGMIEVEVPPADGTAFDAVDLPSIESIATAVGNNQQINSDVSVQLHDAQVVFNTCFDCSEEGGETNLEALGILGVAALALNDDGDDVDAGEVQVDGGDNLHTDIALLGSLAAVLGVISPSDISANSHVFNITNATVDSSATAVANNIGVNVEAAAPGDHLVIGDITQFAFANVTATSTVHDVDISNYANMGVLDGPIVSSVATAVGNNVTVNVGGIEP